MTNYRRVCLSVVLLALAGCKKKEGGAGPDGAQSAAAVVTVDGTALTFGEMDRRAQGLLRHAQEKEGLAFAPTMLPQATEHFRKRAINTFVYQTVMLNEAARLDITISEKEHAAGLQKFAQALTQKGSNTNAFFNNGPLPPDLMRRDFESSLLIDKMLSKEASKRIQILDQEVEAMAAELVASNAVRRATLEAARKQILDGAPFEDVARTMSEHSASAKSGGDLGEFAHGKSGNAAFDAAAFALPVGQVSEVVDTQFGYHLIKVTAKNPAQPEKDGAPAVPETVRASHILILPLSTNRTQIATALYNRKFAESCKSLYDELVAKASIECPLFPDMVYSPPFDAQ